MNKRRKTIHKKEGNKAFKICRKIMNNPKMCVLQILEREETESKAEKKLKSNG